jgi:hypothetical protein
VGCVRDRVKSLHFHHWHYFPMHAERFSCRCTDFTPSKKTVAKQKAGGVKDTLHDMFMAQTHYAIFFTRNRGRLGAGGL